MPVILVKIEQKKYKKANKNNRKGIRERNNIIRIRNNSKIYNQLEMYLESSIIINNLT